MGQRELLTLMSAIMALMALGIDTMLPAFDEIREAFDLGEASPRAGQVITVFFLGMAIAQLACPLRRQRNLHRGRCWISLGTDLRAPAAQSIRLGPRCSRRPSRRNCDHPRSI
jgi:uncharacterized membrane protein YdfJ with MMPL/SSD domain